MTKPIEHTKTPPSPEVLRMMRQQGLNEQAAMLEQLFNIDMSKIEGPLAKFVTCDDACIKLKSAVRNLSVHPDSVLIRGETGTGKELIARALHGMRPGAFVAINCAGMPEQLIESELFGYAAGSFTGAKGTTDGLITTANYGTLFLDEIGDMPFGMQAKLLRAIEQKTIRKVGGKDEEPVTCRFVAASHHDLTDSTRFRTDLYARLATFELFIPPLHDRPADVKLIAETLFPDVKIPWSWEGIPLPLNVRDVQRLVRRFQVLNEKPV